MCSTTTQSTHFFLSPAPIVCMHLVVSFFILVIHTWLRFLGCCICYTYCSMYFSRFNMHLKSFILKTNGKPNTFKAFRIRYQNDSCQLLPRLYTIHTTSRQSMEMGKCSLRWQRAASFIQPFFTIPRFLCVWYAAGLCIARCIQTGGCFSASASILLDSSHRYTHAQTYKEHRVKI